MTTPRVYIGWDPREEIACNVAARSLCEHSPSAQIVPLDLMALRTRGMYWRPTTVMNNSLFDVISNAPMSTEHAISRFLVPHLMRHAGGWALFVDGDVLFRRPIEELWALRHDRYALMCVQHPPLLEEGVKKDGQPQQAYHRKNWSSVMLFNCSHPANKALMPDYVNEVPGRELHAFGWLEDELIGALAPEWNYLVGVSAPIADPAIVHYTLGTPSIPKYAQSPFADEWYACALRAGHGQGHI
jgi:hypothetical protein